MYPNPSQIALNSASMPSKIYALDVYISDQDIHVKCILYGNDISHGSIFVLHAQKEILFEISDAVYYIPMFEQVDLAS